MKENDILLSHIHDLKDKSATESIVVCTNFLSVDEISLLLKNNRSNSEYTDTFFFGGYSDAERKLAVFIPKFYEINEDDIKNFLDENTLNPVCALKITKDRFSSLSHRDYLGAIMGLGIKRDTIGDILINDDGCILFCLKSISGYLIENLKQAGRGQLSVTEYIKTDIDLFESNTDIIFLSVASLRLDCVVAAAFKLSRTVAVEMIKQGVVYVNSLQILKTDYSLNPGDKLVLRGKGKIIIEEITGKSKKGRIHINIKRYL